MVYTPSICGGFLSDKRSLVAFTWTITTVLTLLAFLTAIVLTIEIHTHYRRLVRYYEGDDWYQQYIDDAHNNGDNGDPEHGRDKENDWQKLGQEYLALCTLSAKGITFAALYTMTLAVGLSLYGSTAIVGFTSLRGVYIAPCFSSDYNNMRVGIFGGAIVLFANLLLVCAVILGEVRVSDHKKKKIVQFAKTRNYIPVHLFPDTRCIVCFKFFL